MPLNTHPKQVKYTAVFGICLWTLLSLEQQKQSNFSLHAAEIEVEFQLY